MSGIVNVPGIHEENTPIVWISEHMGPLALLLVKIIAGLSIKLVYFSCWTAGQRMLLVGA